MNVVDSSCWIEYLGDGQDADVYAAAIEDTDRLVVPSITLFEVFKRVTQLAGESAGLDAAAVMLQGRVVDLSASLALGAARISLTEGLAMADAIILATARADGATLWTRDAHFAGIEGVQYSPAR